MRALDFDAFSELNLWTLQLESRSSKLLAATTAALLSATNLIDRCFGYECFAEDGFHSIPDLGGIDGDVYANKCPSCLHFYSRTSFHFGLREFALICVSSSSSSSSVNMLLEMVKFDATSSNFSVQQKDLRSLAFCSLVSSECVVFTCATSAEEGGRV